MACLTDLAGNLLTDDTNSVLTDLAGSDCDPVPHIPGYGRSRREHGLGGAVYKIVNPPGM